MYALPALTSTAADAVRAQFAMDVTEQPVPAPGRTLDRARAALAEFLYRASRTIAPPPPTLAPWRG